MALPFSFTGVLFSVQNHFHGPFKETDQYAIWLDSTDISIIEAWSSPDNDPETWTEQDSADKPNATNDILSLSGHLNSNSIYIAHQEATTGRVGFSRFDTSSHATPDNWGIVNETVESPAQVPSDANMGVSIVRRGTGDPDIILYSGDTDDERGTEFERVDYARRNGGTWTVGIQVSAGGGADHVPGRAVLGSSDKVHLFWYDTGAETIGHRSLNSSNTLSSIETVDTLTNNADFHIVGPGVGFDDGTERIRVPYGEDRNKVSLGKVDADGTPTTVADISDELTGDGVGLTPKHTLALDGTTVHLLYAGGGALGADDDLYHDQAVTTQDAGDWGTDVELLDAVDVNTVTNEVYTRNGTKVLAYLYDDGGAEKYNEEDIAVVGATHPGWISTPGGWF